MLECRISITRYPSNRHFIHRYGIAITRPAHNAEVKDIDTDDELSRILEDVCGHTKEEAKDILEELGRNPQYGPYSRSIDESTLTQNGF
jgi:hypothetical protein